VLGLPDDYDDLTQAGKRLARRALASQRDTPEDYVAAWHFFRSYYLSNPKCPFYDHWVDPAPGHYEWAYVEQLFPRAIVTAHRGSAKSTIWSKEFPLLDAVTQPLSSNFIILSSDEKVERHLDSLMIQIEHNDRIVEDFGKLKPNRNSGIWNRHCLRLTNRAMVLGGTINSMNLRGERPGRIVLDDVERDPKPGTNIEALIQQTETFFFQVVLPMARGHTRIRLCGTPNNKKTLIWRLQNGEVPDERLDPKRWHNVQYWFKTPEGGVFWPAEYPTEEVIEQKRREMGPDVWAMEMLGEETSGENALLVVDPIKNEYDIDDPSAFQQDSPLTCTATASWRDSVPTNNGEVMVPRQETFSKWANSLYRFITVDYAATFKSTSDYSVIHTFGVDRLNQLFSLDLWDGKVPSDRLIDEILRIARVWRVKAVHVEATALQVQFFARVAERMSMVAAGQWVPQVVPLRHPHGVSKPERILNCRSRFRSGTVKYPVWRKSERPYRQLYLQTGGFIPDVTKNSTGLGNDDHIDTLAMGNTVAGGRRAAIMSDEPATTVPDMIRQGVKELYGLPVGTLVPLNQMPDDCLERLLEQHRPKTEKTLIQWEAGGL